MGRWMKPEIYPLLAPVSFVIGVGVFSLVRHLVANPAVRINKDDRSTAIVDNNEEGEKYAEHKLRKFLRTQRPEIMPTINKFFSKDD